MNPDGLIYKVRVTTAIMYYAIRALAILVVSALLTWNLVRALSKSSSADQKVVAKNAIVDTVVSMALIMFMHIIIILILNVNELFLNFIAKITPYADSGNFFDALEGAIFNSNYILTVASLVVYAILEWQTFKYILVYIQRFLTIVFLIIISPIVPITYATDKMRGGKGVALNGWFKELVFNVFVQSLHAIVYAALVSTAMAALTSSNSVSSIGDLSSAMVAIVAMLFIKYAEKMAKTIFGFDNSQILNTNIIGNAASTVISVGNSVVGSTTRVAQRAAAGGPLVSFGQNLDGSHIGIGQVVEGLGNSAGRNFNHIKNVRNSFKNGLQGLGVNGEKLETLNESESTETQSTDVKVKNSNTKIESAVKKSQEHTMPSIEKAEIQNAYINAMPDANYELNRKKGLNSMPEIGKDEFNTAEGNSYSRNGNENKNDLNSMPEIDKNEFNKININSYFKSHSMDNSKNSYENRKDVSSMTEIDKAEINNAYINNNSSVEGGLKKTKDLNSMPELKVEGNNNEKLAEELKRELKLHLGDDKKAQDNFRKELKNNFLNLRNSFDKEKRMEIEAQISSIDTSKPDELKKYLNSFEKGSKEREFADSFAKYWNMANLGEKDTEDYATKDILNYYKAQGLDVSEEVYNIKESKEVEKIVYDKNNVGGESKVSMTSNEAFAPKIEAVPELSVGKINDSNLRKTLEELSSIDPYVKYKFSSKLEGEVQNEIEEEFSSKIDEFTRKMGREPEGIEDIRKNMEAKARKQFDEYKAGNIKPMDLEGDAKNLAMLEIEAKHLGFSMTVNDGPVKTAGSSSQVIEELAKTKREKIKITRNKNNNNNNDNNIA